MKILINMKKHLIGIIIVIILAYNTDAQNIYKNPDLPIEERVQDLLSKMTLDEKIAQITSVSEVELDNQKGDLNRRTLDEDLLKHGLGQLARSGENLEPEETVAKLNELQHFLVNKTRLGIPAMIHEECLHGVMMKGATIFPQAIGRASSWDVVLEEKVASAIAKEMRSRGANLAFTPNIDLGRDPRYGRTEETFGEDPYLTSRFAVAMINGFQGKDKYIDSANIAATVKHYGGSGQPVGGLNQSYNNLSERTMREADLVPFKAAVMEADVCAVMPSYTEYNGISCHTNHWLLKDVLRNEWGFKGMVVSDYGGIARVKELHHQTNSLVEAAEMALKAGLDSDVPNGQNYHMLKDKFINNEIPISYLDNAVAHVLYVKFRLGLFENAIANEDFAKAVNNSLEHQELALESARSSMVLLKNDKNTLPLDISKIKSIAVIGPNADQVHFGAYSIRSSQDRGITILEGIKNKVDGKIAVNYAEGCKIHKGDGYWRLGEIELNDPEDDQRLINEAVNVAKKSDVVILALGGTPRSCRESFGNRIGDRNELDLVGRQEDLVDAIIKTGKPVIVYLMNGRPLAITEIKEKVPAIIEGWYLGEATGTAVAEVVFGEINPSGKLPISFPRSVGHLPVYYNKKPSAFLNRYVLEKNEPLFPFGHGLSYTDFDYSNLTFQNDILRNDDSLRFEITLKNTGDFTGKEVVQIYINDLVSSVTTPYKELKAFKKVELIPSESQTIEFSIPINQLGLWNKNMEYVIEPGELELMIGSSSEDIRLRETFEVK